MNAVALILVACLPHFAQCKSIVQHPAPRTHEECNERALKLQHSLAGTIVRSRGDILAVTDSLRRAERSWLHVKTDPSGGIVAADQLFTSKPLPAMRQVIDVSGDGRQNSGEMAAAVARDDAVAHGAIINGLPITSGAEADVDTWYRDNVIGGPGAFLIVADGYDAFADAFRKKLTLEVAGLAPGAPPATSDAHTPSQQAQGGPKKPALPVVTPLT